MTQFEFVAAAFRGGRIYTKEDENLGKVGTCNEDRLTEIGSQR